MTTDEYKIINEALIELRLKLETSIDKHTEETTIRIINELNHEN